LNPVSAYVPVAVVAAKAVTTRLAPFGTATLGAGDSWISQVACGSGTSTGSRHTRVGAPTAGTSALRRAVAHSAPYGSSMVAPLAAGSPCPTRLCLLSTGRTLRRGTSQDDYGFHCGRSP
jgi:hypothetical protein